MRTSRLLDSTAWVLLLTLAALVGRLTALDDSRLHLIWPAAGVAALWLLLHRDRSTLWLDALLLVGVVTAVDALTGTSLDLAVGLGVTNLGQALVFAAVFRRLVSVDDRGPLLLDLRSLGALLAAAGLAAVLGGLVGTAMLYLESGTLLAGDFAIWLTRNGVAMLLVGSLGLRLRQLVLTRRGRLRSTAVLPFDVPRGWRAAELVLVVLVSVLSNVLVFALLPDYPIAFPLYAVTAWVALRFDTTLTAMRNIAAAVVAISYTLADQGPFVDVADLGARALIVQCYVGLGAVLGLALALGRDERTVLLHRVRRAADAAGDHARQVQVLADASRGVLLADDARSAVCAAVRDVTGADGVYLLEPDGLGNLVSSTAQGVELPPLCVSLDPTVSITGRVYASGRAVFIADLASAPDVSPALVSELGIASAYWQPAALADDRVVAIIGLVWQQQVWELPPSAGQVLEVLGYEAARAIERGNLLEELARAADRDQLTGLANRRRWDELSGVEVSRAQRSQLPLTLLLLDLDHFKAYNDTLGHAAGDVLLRDFAAAAADCQRDGDLIARWGGEEFVVALPDCTADQARPVAERILAAVPHGQTATVGIAQWCRGESSADTLARADAALYQGKHAGRARAVLAAQPVLV